MVAVVESGRKWGALKAGGKERRWSKGRWWKEARKLDSDGMRARAGHAIILRNSLVERGGDVKEPSGFELRWPCPCALADAAGEVGKVLEEGQEIIA